MISKKLNTLGVLYLNLEPRKEVQTFHFTGLHFYPNVSLLDELKLLKTIVLNKGSFSIQLSITNLYSPVGRIAKIDPVAFPVRFLTLMACRGIERFLD